MFDSNLALAAKYTGEIEFSIEERDEAHATSRMLISKGMLNPFGTIHAGAMIWMADVTATVLALQSTRVNAEGRGFPLAINISTNLIRNQREGVVTAESKFVHKGKRVKVIRTKILGQNNTLLAEVTTTHVPA
jgi:1,4-dihydroxy-2-naphthoyl-CoA hydrolase